MRPFKKFISHLFGLCGLHGFFLEYPVSNLVKNWKELEYKSLVKFLFPSEAYNFHFNFQKLMVMYMIFCDLHRFSVLLFVKFD